MEDEGHPLQFPWTFSYFKKVANKSYEDNTFTLGTTASVRRPCGALLLLSPQSFCS